MAVTTLNRSRGDDMPSKSVVLREWSNWIARGGPEQEHFDELTRFWQVVHEMRLAKLLNDKDLDVMWEMLGSEGMNETLQGFVRRRPHGYYGDFEIIDKIYTNFIAQNEKYRKWDEYFQAQAAPNAVRNRKKYFLTWLEKNAESRPAHVLNLASGPCRDVAEAIAILGDHVKFTCVESDKNAIQYAESVLSESARAHVELIHGNVFRFRAKRHYDLLWSGGLFDYFTDDQFKFLLSRAAQWVKPGGEIVVGNFSPSNPSRAYMESCGGWILHHRTREQLLELAHAAGFKPERASLGDEPLGVNIFLHIKV